MSENGYYIECPHCGQRFDEAAGDFQQRVVSAVVADIRSNGHIRAALAITERPTEGLVAPEAGHGLYG